MMEIVNLTPHEIKIRLNPINKVTIPESQNVARVQFSTTYLKTVAGIPVHERVTEKINAMPKLKHGVMYIVSSLCQDNMDEDILQEYLIVSPDRYDAFLSSSGKVLEVAKLVRFKH